MAKTPTPCCWASNSLSRDKENYIRCSTRPNSTAQQNDKKGKKGSKDMCCSAAFQLRKEQEASKQESDDSQCAPPKKKGKKKNKPNKENFNCFTANMICLKLYMPGRDFEYRDQLQISASIWKGCKPLMCANRIDVNCMPQAPSCQFSMLAECLEKELQDGITLSVVYMKKEIGRGCYVLPDRVIYRMVNTLEEVVHTANVELTCKGCTVGICTVRLSMRMRCQTLDSESTTNDEDACGDQSHVTSSTDPCLGFASIEDPSDDSSGICPSSDDNKSRRQAGCEFPCDKLVDMAGPYSVYGHGNNNDDCLEIAAAPGPGGQFAIKAKSHLGEGNTNRFCPQISAPQLKQMGIKKERECPMCHEDVSWLPQISACPHCGYKQLPTFDEKDYDEKATAKDILLEFFEQIGADMNNYGDGPANNCPQPCEGQQPNVRTSEAFDDIVQSYKSLKKSIKKCQSSLTCPSLGKTSQKGEKKQTEQNLLTVFTELKRLFNVGADEEEKQAKIQEICDEACKLAKASKRRGSRKSTSKKQDPCGVIRKRKKHSKPKALVKSKVYSPMEPLDHARQGHAHCYDDKRKVPPHMGWLWTHGSMGQHPGWRPGAIRRSIRHLMGYFLKDFPVDSIPISKYMSYHKNKQRPAHSEQEKPEDLLQVPTLHIEKKNDEYLITLRPLKDAESLKRSANPYVKMKPVQFRIVKNPLLKQVRELKRCLKNMGFSKCTCHRPVMECYCRSFIDKKQLVDELQRQCHKRQMPTCEEELVLSDTTDSEAEFDFGVTPPAGLMRPERLKTTHTTHAETQYNENDWAMPTMFPHPPNAHVQYGGCVVGERQGKFPWIFGKGFVHRKPKPPKMRNLPKKKRKKTPGAPRIEGGYTSDVEPMRLTRRWNNEDPLKADQSKRDHLKGDSAKEDRLERLNRAAYPPTALQFKQSRNTINKRVRFDTNI